jgi:hypothetical protein
VVVLLGHARPAAQDDRVDQLVGDGGPGRGHRVGLRRLLCAGRPDVVPDRAQAPRAGADQHPPERYYLWQSLFTLPITLLWITLFAASARQVARRLGGTGTYGSDLGVLAFTQSAPMLALM